MNLLPEAFAIASISGLWPPLHWQSSRSLRTLYRAYTCLTLAVMLLILVSQIAALIFLTGSVEELAEAAYLFLTAVNCSVKCVNMLTRRQTFVDLLELFDDEKCIPRNDEEARACARFDRTARYLTLSVMSLGIASACCLGIGPLVTRGDDYVFTMRTWQPYEITSEVRYYVTQAHQIIAIAIMLLWNTASDFTCPGFMIQICSQLRLMYRRLRCLPGDSARQRRLVKRSVLHHLRIFEMTERLRTAFTPAIVSQYLLSSFVLCISVYQLTINRSDFVQIVVMFLYVIAMTVELFMYCWFGNEVTETSLQFSEMIFRMDWMKLDVSNRKALLIMMLRSSLPIRITCGPLITLSNGTFARIMKLSYSVFNVLQRTRI